MVGGGCGAFEFGLELDLKTGVVRLPGNDIPVTTMLGVSRNLGEK